MLGKGLADALRHPAMDLAFECQPVDDGADIVDDDVAQHLGGTGLGIDLDLADMAAIGKFGILSEKRRLRIRKTVAPRL
jgi:hypothetical protein